MSTKVRYVLALGNYYKGADVVRLLSQNPRLPANYNKRPKTPEEFQKAAVNGGGKLWIFREPRNVSFRRSRYQQLVMKLGIGRNLKKKRGLHIPGLGNLVQEAPNGIDQIIGHAGGNNGGTFQAYQQAVAAAGQQVPGGWQVIEDQ